MKTLIFEKRANHPLNKKTKIHSICTWEEFMNLWQKAETYEEMLGLLHSGFDVMNVNSIDRLTFYFSIADSWYFGEKINSDHDGSQTGKSKYTLKQKLAKKAYEMICQNFFKFGENMRYTMSQENERLRWWKENVFCTPLLSVILNFFVSKDEDGELDIYNLIHHRTTDSDYSHNELIVFDFIFKFTDFLFEWREKDFSWISNPEEKSEREQENIDMRQKIDLAKPLIILVLNHIGKLDVLESRLMELDASCLNTLKNVAMEKEFHRYSHPVSSDRKVNTIDEACYLNSPAAWLIKKYELLKKVETKLEEIKEAERTIEQAQRKIKQNSH